MRNADSILIHVTRNKWIAITLAYIKQCKPWKEFGSIRTEARYCRGFCAFSRCFSDIAVKPYEHYVASNCRQLLVFSAVCPALYLAVGGIRWIRSQRASCAERVSVSRCHRVNKWLKAVCATPRNPRSLHHKNSFNRSIARMVCVIDVLISSLFSGAKVYLAWKSNIMPWGADVNLHDWFSVHSGTLAIQHYTQLYGNQRNCV